MTFKDDAVSSGHRGCAGGAWTDSMELVRQLAEVDAVAIKLRECFHQTPFVEQHFDLVLVPVDEAVKKLVSAREAARALGMEISIFACTEARRAVAVNRDRDTHDRKFLNGLTFWGALHGYCGGLDASISRALIYAPHADVVCFKSATADISEARRFAAAIRATCPEKQLAFGYSPKPDGPRWNEADHAAFESELFRVGFDYYFYTQFGSVVFPQFTLTSSWVMLDDALKSASPDVRNAVHLPAVLRGSRFALHGAQGQGVGSRRRTVSASVENFPA